MIRLKRIVAGTSPWVRWPLAIWAVAGIAIFSFAPTFDFGFDGVVFSMAFSLVTLLGAALLTLGLRYLVFLLRDQGPSRRP